MDEHMTAHLHVGGEDGEKYDIIMTLLRHYYDIIMTLL